MPPPTNEPQQVDFRSYIGIIFFRWQIIAVCFLYCLLAGVLYIDFAAKRYQTVCKITMYRDPLLTVSASGAEWTSFPLHKYMLTNKKLTERVAGLLREKWGDKFTNPRQMELPVIVSQQRDVGRLLTVSVDSDKPAYAEAFLTTLVNEHRAEWQNLQRQSADSASKLLESELERLEHQIKVAEDDQIEYQRLHDIARVSARSTMESRYLEAIMERKNQLSTELMLLEAQNPAMKGEGPAVISEIARLNAETGAVKPVAAEPEEEPGREKEKKPVAEPEPPASLLGEPLPAPASETGGWQDLRTRRARLEQKEKELARDFTPEHPQLLAVRKEIADVKSQLEMASQVELAKLKDRHKALTIQLSAIEAAEYKWQAKNLLANQRRAEFNRIASVVVRYSKNYDMLYSRLHDMRVSEELKAEQFNVSQPAETLPEPIWPDPAKILLVALALGLGSGFGLALLIQTLDNKVQSIKDVEQTIGVPFLGGVPFWVHSGLEHTVRPIVTEEHSSGAVEAYRALRTSVLTALEKLNEKIVLITSADSREGKTLTALNLAIMTAQMGKRVLLLDMDLRRGRLHRSLGIERGPGMTDALREHKSVREFISGTRFERLDMVPTGNNTDDAAELLQSTGFDMLLAGVQDDYDYIVVDTSPVLRVTDTVILAAQGIGVCLYVARVNHTPKPLIQYSLSMLKEARVLGLVLNSIEMHKISSLYYTYQYPNYAYYSNAYAYGYDYYHYGDEAGKRHKYKRSADSWKKRRADLAQWARKTFLPME